MDQKDADFMKVFAAILGGLAVFTVVIIIAANAISSMEPGSVSSDPMVQAAINERIAPVGQVNTADVQVAAAPAGGAADGKGTYDGACAACHATGAAGAPKFGDKGAWKDRIAKGLDTLYSHAINGFNAMPPKGGRADLSDDAVKAAVKYMVDNSK